MLKKILILVVLMISGCASVSVQNDYNPEYDFNRLSTYMWLNVEDKPGQNTRLNNSLIKERVRNGVDRALAAKGYTLLETGQATFKITWLGAINKKLQIDSISNHYRPYGYGSIHRDPYWSTHTTSRVREYEEGTLVIDFLDPKSHKLIWRGSGTGRIRENQTPEQSIKAINEAVQQILGDFPPGRK